MKIVHHPVGIEWRRTGRHTWIATVYRKAETELVWEPSDFGNAAARVSIDPPYGLLGPSDGLFGGLFGCFG